MPSKTSRTEPIEVVGVGYYDPMSRAAAQFGLPLCPNGSPSGKRCTRAAGHFESLPRHPGTLHVVTTKNYIAVEVW